jgi:Tir chaperone protein (CesT) family
MPNRPFKQLLEEFAALVAIDQPALFLREGNVTLDEVTFSLVASEQDEDATMYIYADFGDLPPRRELELCMALMEANLILYPKQGPIFGISSRTRRVAIVHRVPLAPLTAGELREVLADLAGKAKEWGKNSFLDLKPTPAGADRSILRKLGMPRE